MGCLKGVVGAEDTGDGLREQGILTGVDVLLRSLARCDRWIGEEDRKDKGDQKTTPQHAALRIQVVTSHFNGWVPDFRCLLEYYTRARIMMRSTGPDL